jgi:hypothetical protein
MSGGSGLENAKLAAKDFAKEFDPQTPFDEVYAAHVRVSRSLVAASNLDCPEYMSDFKKAVNDDSLAPGLKITNMNAFTGQIEMTLKTPNGTEKLTVDPQAWNNQEHRSDNAEQKPALTGGTAFIADTHNNHYKFVKENGKLNVQRVESK